jgi:thioredoxin-like negative regulator of GroEL
MNEILIFTNPGCAPCSQVKAMIPELTDRLGEEFTIETHCTQTEREISRKYKIWEQPCTVLVIDGKERLRLNGAYLNMDFVERILKEGSQNE